MYYITYEKASERVYWVIKFSPHLFSPIKSHKYIAILLSLSQHYVTLSKRNIFYFLCIITSNRDAYWNSKDIHGTFIV